MERIEHYPVTTQCDQDIGVLARNLAITFAEAGARGLRIVPAAGMESEFHGEKSQVTENKKQICGD
ncbi:hypothetical protein GCM10011367_06130 [Marinicauda pacifica]|nr:hypothetical protein GCM10011367_06130 [Marinicauda pacifica]